MARAVEFLGKPASVRKARAFTGDVLADDRVEGSVIELAELLVSASSRPTPPSMPEAWFA